MLPEKTFVFRRDAESKLMMGIHFLCTLRVFRKFDQQLQEQIILLSDDSMSHQKLGEPF